MEKIAVIDVGTNNVLLLIARKNGDSVQVLKRKSAISALGRNMKNNKITLSALKRLKKILYEYIEYSKLFTSKIIVVGTSCAREAQNSNVIKEWLKKTHSIYFKIISGEEEAYLNGVANLTDFPNKKMVFFDVGGGSTEFTYVDNGKICRVFSLKLGIRRLHNDFSDLSNRLKFTKKNLQKLPKQNTELVGIGGTATTLAAISQKINNYETANLHKQEVNLEEINNIFNNIKNSSKKDLQKLMPFEPERAEIILSGTMVIKEIIAYFEANKILVSDKGLQYGILNLPHKKLKEYLGKK